MKYVNVSRFLKHSLLLLSNLAILTLRLPLVHYAAGVDIQQINFHVDVRGEHASLIRNIGARSTVLLKNTNNALPLSKPKFLAVIGEDAGPNAYGPNGMLQSASLWYIFNSPAILKRVFLYILYLFEFSK